MKDLAVENKQKYNFDPKILLERITAVYANFSSQEEFAAAVARDARSYNHETFQRAASILRRYQELSKTRAKKRNRKEERKRILWRREEKRDAERSRYEA